MNEFGKRVFIDLSSLPDTDEESNKAFERIRKKFELLRVLLEEPVLASPENHPMAAAIDDRRYAALSRNIATITKDPDLLLDLYVSGLGTLRAPDVIESDDQDFWQQTRGEDTLHIQYKDAPDATRKRNEINRASYRADYVPLCDTSRVLNLSLFELNDRVRQSGLGRRLMNVMQQALTRNRHHVQFIVVSIVHWPMFLTIDSHYGWIRTKYLDAKTPPALIYPFSLDTTELKMKLKNKKATLKYTDLEWTTPLNHTDGRLGSLYLQFNREFRQQCFDAFSILNDRLQYPAPHTDTIRVPLSSGSHTGPLAFKLDTVELTRFLDKQRGLAEVVVVHCKALGNSDSPFETFMFSHDVPAILLDTDFLDPPALEETPTRMALMVLLLAYLVDHCRVMYRPIMISDPLMQQLIVLFGLERKSHIHLTMTIMSQPSPIFTRINNDTWLWLPVKKTRTTDATGDVFIEPPMLESPAVVIDDVLTRDRPSKKSRTDTRCVHCASSLADNHPVHTLALCSTACRVAYYTD